MKSSSKRNNSRSNSKREVTERSSARGRQTYFTEIVKYLCHDRDDRDCGCSNRRVGIRRVRGSRRQDAEYDYLRGYWRKGKRSPCYRIYGRQRRKPDRYGKHNVQSGYRRSGGRHKAGVFEKICQIRSGQRGKYSGNCERAKTDSGGWIYLWGRIL